MKMANLFPTELDLAAISVQVEQLAQLLSDVAAERFVCPLSSLHLQQVFAHSTIMNRYALALRILLANLRRKLGMSAVAPAPQTTMSLPAGAENVLVPPSYVDPTSMPAPMTMEELGFAWPSERGIFSPSAIPTWLQEGVSIIILGLP